VPSSGFQFAAPPLTYLVKRLIIVLVCAYVAQLIVRTWLPVVEVLALSPGQPWVWQLLTYVLVNNSDPLSVLFGMLMLWFGLSPFEIAHGTRRAAQLCVVVALGASVPADLLGFVLSPAYPLWGASPLYLGGFAASAWQYRSHRISFFGILPMTGKQFLLLLLGLSVVGYLYNRNATALVADLGAMAAALGFMRWLDRPAPRKPPRRPAARPSGFKVIQGGGQDDRPKWLN
jgi:membrane associated rhomboid family serine protease